MKRSRQHFWIALLAPLMSAALVGGIALENSTHLKPQDVEPFHHRARIAIVGEDLRDGTHTGGIPYSIGSWNGSDVEIPAAAQKLLKPNAILSRSYQDTSNRGMEMNRSASLLIVQCRDTRDMGGHYPPICYPAHGQVQVSQAPRLWKLPGLDIPGMQYEFATADHGQSGRRIVYNFMILPGPKGGIVPDIKGVYRVSEDYQQRYYGAAQFQLVMSANFSEAERDEMFQELVGSNVAVIQTLKTIAVKP